MSKQSPNLQKLKALHHQKHPGALLQKAEEFCRKLVWLPASAKVFVGNISYRLKSRELKEFFGCFGKVICAQIITDRIKKRSRGFGFVTFSNEWKHKKPRILQMRKELWKEDAYFFSSLSHESCSPEKRRKGAKSFIYEPTLQEALECYNKNGGNNKGSGDEAMEDEYAESVYVHVETKLLTKETNKINII
ncbi:hypothetical protein OS493_004381 [Desmophyllum pertusum]|uniref:RRM domain-containing protein n=1 Tax=Desmophyllum pertusum TaxID=174260 RepID=A0A9X0D4U6_9CNID|nr:hypothetical protein OS493_004381 [Desmophyllum pertusum]